MSPNKRIDKQRHSPPSSNIPVHGDSNEQRRNAHETDLSHMKASRRMAEQGVSRARLQSHTTARRGCKAAHSIKNTSVLSHSQPIKRCLGVVGLFFEIVHKTYLDLSYIFVVSLDRVNEEIGFIRWRILFFPGSSF